MHGRLIENVHEHATIHISYVSSNLHRKQHVMLLIIELNNQYDQLWVRAGDLNGCCINNLLKIGMSILDASSESDFNETEWWTNRILNQLNQLDKEWMRCLLFSLSPIYTSGEQFCFQHLHRLLTPNIQHPFVTFCLREKDGNLCSKSKIH